MKMKAKASPLKKQVTQKSEKPNKKADGGFDEEKMEMKMELEQLRNQLAILNEQHEELNKKTE